jgi:hypothetical protein
VVDSANDRLEGIDQRRTAARANPTFKRPRERVGERLPLAVVTCCALSGVADVALRRDLVTYLVTYLVTPEGHATPVDNAPTDAQSPCVGT